MRAFEPAPDLWPPQRNGLIQTIELLEQGVDVCYYSPTGGGKTRVAIELLNWAFERGCTGKFYVNRRLLIEQTAARFREAGLPYGIRAAEYDDQYDWSAPTQICSADTERVRVYQKNIWPAWECDLIIVDEAHLQRTGVMRKILKAHRAKGGRVVLLTATPVGLSNWADQLVISGTLKEYRECGALVPAVTRSIEQPDLRKVKRNKTGEYILDDRKKAIYTQSIVANVYKKWREYNPDGRLTFLYAPGVKESVWFTAEFRKKGVNWCHIDATEAMIDGRRQKLTRTSWTEIQERLVDGDIKGVSSRFKLREGVDMPSAYHAILATPIGSLTSYLQTIGRILRYSPETPDHVVATDHGGCYHNFGSANHQRPWEDWWSLPERVVSEYQYQGYREQTIQEPIRCPQCETERPGGITCPICAFEHPKSQRRVIQEDGELRTVDGPLVKPKRVARRHNTADEWKWLVLRNRKYRKQRTFRQLEAFFNHEHHHYPPRDIPYMPKHSHDFYRVVCDVPEEALIPE